MDSLLDNMPLETLLVAKQILYRTVSKIRDGKVIKADGKFGIFLGSGLDDPGKREIEMFETLRDELAKSASSDKAGKAVSKFVGGLSVKDGKPVMNEKKLDQLNKELSTILGSDVADSVAKDVKSIIEKQYSATKQAVSEAVKEYKRSIDLELNSYDQRMIKTLSKRNNFFISGVYDEALIKHVNDAVAMHVTEGLPKNQLAKELKAVLAEKIPPRADYYYKMLANDVINRARITSQINSYSEAKIRRYQIFAVLDERTSEICEYMDGRIFEVEVARKIVTDTVDFGVPTSQGDAEKFKALRPWVYIDEEMAAKGKDALYFKGQKGEEIFLPDSKFKSVDGGLKLKSAKPDGVSTEIQDLGGRNHNPPMLPPFHANCRTTTVIDEEDVREQIAEEAQSDLQEEGVVPTFIPAKTRDEAEDFIVDNLLDVSHLEDLNIPRKDWKKDLKSDKYLNTDGIPLEILNSFNEQFFLMRNKYNLRKLEYYTNLVKGEEKTIAAFSYFPDTGAGGLSINKDFINKVKAEGFSFDEYLSNAYKDGFIATKNKSEIAYHEAAHYFQRMKPIPMRKVEEAYQTAMDKGISVSLYGDTKSTEFFAEAAVVAKRDGIKSFAPRDLAEILEEILP